MKTLKHIAAEEKLLLKSIGCVAVVTLFVFFFMRHSAPAKERDKAYGSGVQLLLTKSAADGDNFSRWAELNRPSNVYGYNSAGIFTRSLVMGKKLQLPCVRGVVTEKELPLPGIPAAESVAVVLEKNPLRPQLAVPERKNAPGSFAVQIPVYSDKGEILFEVASGNEDNRYGTLLVKAENSVLGPRFRVVESSGNRKFDDRVTDLLKQKVREGKHFSGILAVWPGGGQGK